MPARRREAVVFPYMIRGFTSSSPGTATTAPRVTRTTCPRLGGLLIACFGCAARRTFPRSSMTSGRGRASHPFEVRLQGLGPIEGGVGGEVSVGAHEQEPAPQSAVSAVGAQIGVGHG